MATTQAAATESTLQDLAKRHLWLHFSRMGAYNDGAEIPIIVSGDGCYVWDEHGNRYLDGLSALFCVNIGHGRHEVAQAGADQAKELGFFTTWSYAHPRAIELAARLASIAPGDLNRVFFTSAAASRSRPRSSSAASTTSSRATRTMGGRSSTCSSKAANLRMTRACPWGASVRNQPTCLDAVERTAHRFEEGRDHVAERGALARGDHHLGGHARHQPIRISRESPASRSRRCRGNRAGASSRRSGGRARRIRGSRGLPGSGASGRSGT